MRTFVRGVQHLVLLVVRVAFGLMMVLDGWHRWNGQGIGAQVAFLSQFSVPSPRYIAWALVVVELVGGIFLVVGALTPLIALLFVAEQVLTVAYVSFYHRDPVTVSGTLVQGWEHDAALGAIALLLFVFGAGKISVDQLFRRRRDDGDDGDEDEDLAPTVTGRVV